MTEKGKLFERMGRKAFDLRVVFRPMVAGVAEVSDAQVFSFSLLALHLGRASHLDAALSFRFNPLAGHRGMCASRDA